MFCLLLANLIAYGAGRFAGRLAGSLAFSAATGLNRILQRSLIYSNNMFGHHLSLLALNMPLLIYDTIVWHEEQPITAA